MIDFLKYEIKNLLENIILFNRELRLFRPWDFSFNLKLLCRSLELTRLAMLSNKSVSENAESNAIEIQKFLDLIHRYDNSVSIAEIELGVVTRSYSWIFSERTPEQEENLDKVYKLSSEIEQKAWNDAMDLLKERMQYWWD